jgi:hypothetical protein
MLDLWRVDGAGVYRPAIKHEGAPAAELTYLQRGTARTADPELRRVGQ